MDICTFNDHYLNPVLEKLSKENDKKVFIIGDFNIDFIKFDTSEHINKFINDLFSNCLHPQILLPTQISSNSKTIIDNMFSNIAQPLKVMLLQVILLLVYLITFHSFSFNSTFFLIIIPTREMLNYMTGTDLIRTHFLDDFNLTN